MAGCIIFHIYLIQFLDLVLISANTQTGTVAAMLLSVKVLDEEFIAKYDIPGLVLIAGGSLFVLLFANKQ